MEQKIKKDLVKAYSTEDELCTLAEDIALEKKDNYAHILRAYGITEETLINILAEMGYIEL